MSSLTIFETKKLLNNISREKTEITSDELIGICTLHGEPKKPTSNNPLDFVSLPTRRADIYFLISVLIALNIFKRVSKGLYSIDWSKEKELDQKVAERIKNHKGRWWE